MIITKTPYRISFFGGGSDYPQWYQNNGGVVLSTTINKYIYISCRFSPKYFKKKYRRVWRKIENVQTAKEINAMKMNAMKMPIRAMSHEMKKKDEMSHAKKKDEMKKMNAMKKMEELTPAQKKLPAG